MVEKGIELLIFVGGDGTARDVYDVLGLTIPVVGIPSGVKMFSPVFALSTYAAAEIINIETEQLIEKKFLILMKKPSDKENWELNYMAT